MERRQIVKIIEEISKENGYKLNLFSDEWLVVIENGEKKMFIPSFRFPNNDAGVAGLCNDKCALSEYLTYNRIPCIPHTFFWFGEKENSEKDINEFTKILRRVVTQYGGAVVKPNNGTGGNDVYKITDITKVELFAERYRKATGMFAVSPYVEIDSEYRTIICENRIMLTFEKIRPFVIADGKRSYFDYLKEKGYEICPYSNDYLPEKGDKVILQWKHNLQSGAKPLLLNDPPAELTALAEKTTQAVGIKFASIDAVKVKGEFYILEINSGVMMEKFASENDLYYNVAKKVYKTAIENYFNIKKNK